MQPTPEQQAIIKAVKTGHSLRIAAFAGSGKTTTLEMIGRAYPHRKGLYLAYNRAILDEARGQFPDNVSCQTTHSLAYGACGHRYRDKLAQPMTSMQVAALLNIQPLIEQAGKIRLLASSRNMAACARQMINHYCHSAEARLGPQHCSMYHLRLLINRYKKVGVTLQFERQRVLQPETFLERYAHRCLQIAEALWQAMQDIQQTKIGMTHDGYLKLYQLSKPIIMGYDFIMLDEAQDANPVILDILAQQPQQRFYVGDPHQQIYGWRGSLNAMQTLQGDLCHLTQSFRFGQPIAELANHLLQQLGETRLLKANPAVSSHVAPVDPSLPVTRLCRTNAGVLEACMMAIKQKKRVACVGGIKATLVDFQSAYYLWLGKLSRVTSNSIRLHMTWQNLLDEASLAQDRELRGIVKFIMQHQDQCLPIIQTIEAAICAEEASADVILSTAHKAKGRQWSQVALHDDFEDYRQCEGEELNLWYVAATRAIHCLDITAVVSQVSQQSAVLPTQKKKLPILSIELVPQTAWFANVRDILPAERWRRLARCVAKKAGYRCEICGGRGPKWPVECHEVWQYDDVTHRQTLMGMVALCPACHQVKHMGFARVQGQAAAAEQHLCQVNGWSLEQADAYIEAQFALWEKRSQYPWTLDVEVLTTAYGVESKMLRQRPSGKNAK